MNTLTARLDRLVASANLEWKREGHVLIVPISSSNRRQRVRVSRRQDFYVFSSVVVQTAFVTRSDRRWRDLAYRAWSRNTMKELVAFAFDEEDRLVGFIEQPVESLDDSELRLYVEFVARECDRFEYLLTGDDAE